MGDASCLRVRRGSGRNVERSAGVAGRASEASDRSRCRSRRGEETRVKERLLAVRPRAKPPSPQHGTAAAS